MSALGSGIVHLGCGAFHRAHQAWSTQRAIEATGDMRWGIAAVAMNRREVVDGLRSQDNLYTLLLKERDDVRAEVIGSITEAIHAPTDPIGVPMRVAAPQTRIVTLTVTAGGYCLEPASGLLDTDNEAVCHDVRDPGRPVTSIGMLVRGLDLVRRRGGCPPVVISCDNLSSNGRTLRRAAVDYAELLDSRLAEWISVNVQFPTSVVDRIVAPTTLADMSAARKILGGIEDMTPVAAEPFLNWTIEDFDGPRPRWELAGARFVSDATAYELGKLRLLNGTHMLMAYLGTLAGHRTIAEASADPTLAALARQFMLEEQGGTLSLPDSELRHTVDGLMRRFGNPAIRHDLVRVGRNGSEKMMPRVVDALRENLVAGRDIQTSVLLIAAWIRGFATADDSGVIPVDPHRDSLIELAHCWAGDPKRLAGSFLSRTDIFGDLSDYGVVQGQLAGTLAELARDNIDVVMRRRLHPEVERAAA